MLKTGCGAHLRENFDIATLFAPPNTSLLPLRTSSLFTALPVPGNQAQNFLSPLPIQFPCLPWLQDAPARHICTLEDRNAWKQRSLVQLALTTANKTFRGSSSGFRGHTFILHFLKLFFISIMTLSLDSSLSSLFMTLWHSLASPKTLEARLFWSYFKSAILCPLVTSDEPQPWVIPIVCF